MFWCDLQPLLTLNCVLDLLVHICFRGLGCSFWSFRAHNWALGPWWSIEGYLNLLGVFWETQFTAGATSFDKNWDLIEWLYFLVEFRLEIACMHEVSVHCLEGLRLSHTPLLRPNSETLKPGNRELELTFWCVCREVDAFALIFVWFFVSFIGIQFEGKWPAYHK